MIIEEYSNSGKHKAGGSGAKIPQSGCRWFENNAQQQPALFSNLHGNRIVGFHHICAKLEGVVLVSENIFE